MRLGQVNSNAITNSFESRNLCANSLRKIDSILSVDTESFSQKCDIEE